MEQESTFNSGIRFDTRTPEEKAKDYQFKELVASADPVNWTVKDPNTWRKFPIFNQDGSGSCVAQTQAKEMGIMKFLKDGVYVHFSASDIYQRRANKPDGGMGAIDARQIASQGVTLEVLAPSQNLNDNQMDTVVIEDYKREVGKVFAVPNYIEIPNVGDIDTIASIIQKTGKGVMVWFYFGNISEWTERPVVQDHNLDLKAPATNRHSICAVDFTLLPDGKKALIVEDSWGTSYGRAGQRIIDEDFFKARNWYAGYLMNFKFDGKVDRPKHMFTVDLELGQTNDDIKALQDILKFEGLFPSNVDSTGYFGAVTKKAVQKFQMIYAIPQTGVVGPKTRAKLNEKYGV